MNKKTLLGSSLLLTCAVVLLLIVYYPIFWGKNFLPFSNYEVYKQITEKTNNCILEKDKLLTAIKESNEIGLRQIDYSGISILYPMQKSIALNYQKGILALWDPYLFCGIPTFHEGQYRPFNPFLLPFYFFPNPNIYCFSVFLGVIVGAYFMFLFLKKIGIEKESAIFGACLFVLNPFVQERISLIDHFFSYITAPLIFLTFENLKSLNFLNSLNLLFAFLLMGHIGHPEMNVIITLFATAYFFIYNSNEILKKVFFLGYLGFFILLSLSLYILPLLKFYFNGFHYKETSPKIYVYTELRDFLVISSDINILPILLIFIGISLIKLEKKILFFLISAILCIVYFSRLPFVGSLLTKSGFTLFLPCYFKMIFWFFITVICSYGLNLLLREKIKLKVWIILIFTFLFFFFLTKEISSTLYFPLKVYFKNLNYFYFFSFIPLLFLIIKLPLFKKLDSHFLVYFIIFFAILPYCYPLSQNYIYWNSCDIKTYDCIDFIKEKFPHSRIAAIEIEKLNGFPPNYGSPLNIKQMEMNLFIFPNSSYEILKEHFIYPTQLTFYVIDELLLKKLGVDLIILPNFYNFNNPIFKGKFFSVYKIGERTNRIFFAKKVYCISQNEKIDYPKFVSIPEDSVLIEGLDNIEYEYPQNHNIRFLEDKPHKISIEVKTDKNSILVLRDTYFDEWYCFLDGEKTKIFKVDGLFRGVFVPKGKHYIEFVYRPIIVYFSFIVSLLSHLVFLSLYLYRKLKNI